MKLKRGMALMALTIGCSITAVHAGNNGGDLGDQEGPIGPDDVQYATTEILPGSGVQYGNFYEVTSVDPVGQTFTARVNPVTREVIAISGDEIIYNQLTAEQWQIAESKHEQVRAMGLPALPVAIGIGAGMCYLNDNINKRLMIRACEAEGGTPLVEFSGICGMGATYTCQRLPPPTPTPTPTPTPSPTPTPGTGPTGLWYIGPNGGLWGATATTNLSVQTFDSDWFGGSRCFGCP